MPGDPSTVKKMRPPRISRFKKTINSSRTVPLCFSLLYKLMFLVSFLEQFVVGRPFYSSKENASAQTSGCKRTTNLPRTVPLCFSLLYMFFVFFLEQCIAWRPFYSKENTSAQTFAVQEDDRHAAYSTSLFFPPVHVLSCLFLRSVLPGGASTLTRMRPPRISRCKWTISLPRTVPLCFSLLYMFVVYFPEQRIVGRPFYSKENESALNFTEQKDDTFAAYSTSLFFPLVRVHVFCVFS